MAEPARRSDRPLRCAVVLLVAALLLPRASYADESNARPYLVGSRAAGMGGAFTALADDGSGPYYNPAGIGFVRRSQLSLAGSLYGVASGTITSALGDGHDFKYSNLQTFPTATAGVFKVGPEDDPDHATVLALHVYVPDAVWIDGRDRLASPENAVILSSQSQTVWAGMTYARRWGRISVGVSGFLLFGTDSTQLDLSGQVRITDPATLAQLGCPDYAACATQFATITARTDSTTYGAIGAVGVRWDATDQLRLGLSVYSPEFGFGTRRSFARVVLATTTTPAQVRIVNDDDLHASPSLPLRIQAGVAWTSGRFTLAVDGMYLAAREVIDDAAKSNQGLDRRIVRNAVVNGSVGVEYVIADRFPLRTGFFTDFSSSTGSVDVTNTAHIDRFGGTLSIGLRTNHTHTDVGVMVSGGSGTDVIPNNLDFTTLRQTSGSALDTYLFLGTAYEF